MKKIIAWPIWPSALAVALMTLAVVPATGAVRHGCQEAGGNSGPATQAVQDQAVEGQVLRGRVLGADGLPSPGLRVRGQHATGGDTKGFALSTRNKKQELAQLGPGKTEVEAVTNRLGEFRFEGLVEGSYFVWTKKNGYEHQSVYSVRLSERALAAGEEPVELPPGEYRAVARAETDRVHTWDVAHGGAAAPFAIQSKTSSAVHGTGAGPRCGPHLSLLEPKLGQAFSR